MRRFGCPARIGRVTADPSHALPGRRWSAGSSLGAAGILGFLSLYQLGLVRHLPDLPGAVFDADLVDGSGEAYWLGSAADAPIGMGSFALTAALAAAGEPDRAERRPWLVAAWGVKAGADAAYATALALEQVTRHRRLCVYCLAVTACAWAAVAPVVPEARTAWRAWRAQRRSRRSAWAASGTANGKAAA